jgi:ABC-type branched-subunit amino acid transport system substrate-binding protein
MLFSRIAPNNGTTASRWFAIVPGDRAGREISSDLLKTGRISGIRLETVLPFEANFTNSNTLQEKILEARPSVVLLWLPPMAAGRVAQNLRTRGFTGILAGPGWLRSADFICAAGRALEGVIIPAIVRNQISEVRWGHFRNSYKERWHHEPDAMAELAYDAMNLQAELVAKSEFSAPPHRLTPGFAWAGVTGELTFDSEGNRVAKLELLTGRSGGFVPVE